jgi:carboxylesterase
VVSGEPFVFDGGEIGALVVHGFTGTPYEVRFLGEQLARAGITARGPLLPGHGTSVADLARTTWRQWAAAIEHELDALAGRYRQIALVGQSLGALLVLELASRRGAQIAAVCALAAPLWLDGLAARVARWTAPGHRLAWLRTLPKLGGSDVADRDAKRDNPSYRAIPTRALAELVAFMGVVDAALPRIAAPVLVMHGQRDHTAPVACASHLAARVPHAELALYARSCHLLATDVERDAVATAAVAFIRRHTACAT